MFGVCDVVCLTNIMQIHTLFLEDDNTLALDTLSSCYLHPIFSEDATGADFSIAELFPSLNTLYVCNEKAYQGALLRGVFYACYAFLFPL
jgi:hypothetical protein